MNRTLLALSLIGAVALGGCSTLQTLFSGESVAQQAPQTITEAEKGLTVVHLAYQGVGIALTQAAASGALHGANATTAKGIYDQIGADLDLADQADAAANASGVFAQVAAIQALLAQIAPLIPKTP